jgi:hypothetical protein
MMEKGFVVEMVLESVGQEDKESKRKHQEYNVLDTSEARTKLSMTMDQAKLESIFAKKHNVSAHRFVLRDGKGSTSRPGLVT